MIKQKIYKRILQSLFFLALISPLVVDRRLFYPYVTTSALYFRLIVELLFAMWIVYVLQGRKEKAEKLLRHSEPRDEAKNPEARGTDKCCAVSHGILHSSVVQDDAIKERLPQNAANKKYNFLIIAVLLYFCALALSTVFSVNPYLSFWGDTERMMGLFGMMHFFALFIVGISIFKEKKEIFALINGFTLVSFIMAVYGISQRFGWTSIKPGELRIVATVGNAGTLAGYLIFGLFFSLLLYTKAHETTRNRNVRYALKIFYALSVIVHLIAIFYTGTRGAYLGVGAGFLVMAIIIILKLKSKKLKYSIAGLVAVIILSYGILFLNQNKNWIKNNQYLYRLTHFSISDPTAQTRLLAWKWGIKGFLDKPVLGYGFENYAVPYNKYFEAKYYNLSPEEYFDRAHNIVVELLSTAGIIGLLSYLIIFFALIYHLWRIYKKTGDYIFPSIILGLIIAYFTQNLLIFDMLPQMLGFVILLVAVNNLHGRHSEPDDRREKNSEVRGKDECCAVSHGIPSASSGQALRSSVAQDDAVKRSLTQDDAVKKSLPQDGQKNNSKIKNSTFIAAIILIIALGYSYKNLIIKPYKALIDDVKGQLYYSVGKPDEGMKYLKQSVEYGTFLDLDLRSAAANTIFNYYMDSGIESETKKDDIDYSISLYKENLKSVPDDTYYNYKIGEILNYRFAIDLKEDIIGEANQYINKAISTSQNRARIYYMLAENMLHSGKLEEAKKIGQSALELNPEFGESWWEMAKINFILQDYDNAKKCFIKTIDSGYRISEQNIEQFRSVFNMGDNNDAIEYFRVLIENGTDNYLYYTTIANLYHYQGDNETAIKYAKKALEINPEIKDQVESFIKNVSNGQ